jgi:hypothetical protein
MKTLFTLNTRTNKDNIATAAIVAVCFVGLVSGVFTSNPATANHAADVAIQTLDTIVVTASRAPDVTLDTIVVTASRKIDHA